MARGARGRKKKSSNKSDQPSANQSSGNSSSWFNRSGRLATNHDSFSKSASRDSPSASPNKLASRKSNASSSSNQRTLLKTNAASKKPNKQNTPI